MIGVGADEDTAAIVDDDLTISACGPGGVTVVEGSQIVSTDVAEIEKGDKVAVSGLNVHILTKDCRYYRETRTALIPEKKLLFE